MSADFNTDLLKINQNSKIKDFYDTLISYGMYYTITKPTRNVNNYISLIDNNIINFAAVNYTAGILFDDISDHYPSFLHFSILNPKITDTPNVLNSSQINNVYNLHNYNCFKEMQRSENFFSNLYTVNDGNLTNQITEDPETIYNLFFQQFYAVFHKAFHSPTTTFKKSRHCNSPWITPALIKCCKTKSQLLKIYKRYKNSVSRIKYKNYSRVLKSSIRYAEKKYYEDKLHKKSSNIKDTWKIINSIL